MTSQSGTSWDHFEFTAPDKQTDPELNDVELSPPLSHRLWTPLFHVSHSHTCLCHMPEPYTPQICSATHTCASLDTVINERREANAGQGQWDRV